MGTRHITAVYLDTKYRVAQYGQWDGYPEGTGLNCLKFVRTIVEESARNIFANKVRKCQWATPQYVVNKTRKEDWQKNYPELSCSTGSDILQIVMSSQKRLKLVNSIDFITDGLMCEWAWIIDLDNETFEAFKGFNRQPLTESDRFYFLYSPAVSDYHPARLIAKWQLDNLPTNDEFTATFKEMN